MSYEIRRLIKSKSREGKEELFIHLLISDELGIYEFGKWLSDEDIKLIKKDFGKNYDKCNNLVDFKLLKKNSKIDTVANDYLPEARANRINSLEVEANHKK